jgi:hypothetical protein
VNDIQPNLWTSTKHGLRYLARADLIALDLSSLMHERFAGDRSVTVLDHNLDDLLPALGTFDAVVSSFAIHDVSHARFLAELGIVGRTPNSEPRTPNPEPRTQNLDLEPRT